jgi:hypothetical protein
MDKEILDFLKNFEKDLKNAGIATKFVAGAALLYLYLWYYGLSPNITSIYRDDAKQKDLLARYYQGDPSIKYKPAENSLHSKKDFFGTPSAEAIDISTSNPALAADIAEALKIGAGYRFGDPVHFYHKAL